MFCVFPLCSSCSLRQAQPTPRPLRPPPIFPPDPSPSAASANAAHNWNGLFLIYDRTGKEALIEKIILDMRQDSSKDPPQITPFTAAGVPAIEIKQKDSTSYVTQTGKFLLIAG